MTDITEQRPNFEWTRDRLFELKKCWDYDKMTQAECSKHFGINLNPIAGAINRYRDEYGYETRIRRDFKHTHVVAKINKKRQQKTPCGPTRVNKIIQDRINNGFVDNLKVDNIKSRLQFKERLVAHEQKTFKETEAGITFNELEDNSCRWPAGDKYCGRTTMTGRPYCAQHCVVSRR